MEDVFDFAVHVRSIGRSSLDLETVVTVRGDVIWTIRQKIVLTSLETQNA